MSFHLHKVLPCLFFFLLNLCMASSSNTVQKKKSHSKYIFILKSSPKETYQLSHTKETRLHEMKDETAILHLKLYATTLHVE